MFSVGRLPDENVKNESTGCMGTLGLDARFGEADVLISISWVGMSFRVIMREPLWWMCSDDNANPHFWR